MSAVKSAAKGLGRTQRLVLRTLAGWPGHEAPPTPQEIVQVAYRHQQAWDRRPVTEAERVAGALRSLQRRQLVVRLGVSAEGAGCWRATALGRDVIALVDEVAS